MLDPDLHILFSRYWGKADPANAGAGPGHHTVLGHSLDVAATAYVLVECNPILASQLAECSGIDADSVGMSFAAVCALHDIGKFDTRFQRKAPGVADLIRPESSREDLGSYDHGEQGYQLAMDEPDLSDILDRQLGPSASLLLRAVCGHHGSFPETGAEPDASRSSIKLISLRREDQQSRLAFAQCILGFFGMKGARFPWPGKLSGALMQRLGGLCAVADWVGSNTAFFPYQPAPTELASYWDDASARARVACKQSGLSRIASSGAGFTELFPDYAPRDVQVVTESLKLSEPALVIVEAEMGKGKTEAALSLAGRFLNQGLADGVTVALPTMATSNAMFGRVEEWAPRAFKPGDLQLSLAHGRARRVSKFQRLFEGPLGARDVDAPEASVVCARWFLSRKRILLAQVGVGTIDQALQAALSLRHQFVRMFALSRNVLIIDEVHAYDVYMEVLLEHLLSWLGGLRVPVILLSATLPSQRRAALAAAWSNGTVGAETDDFATASSRAYPLVSVTTASGTALVPGEEAKVQRTINVQYVETTDGPVHLAATAARLVQAAKGGARVAWIRNTVAEAQCAFIGVQEEAAAIGIDTTLFHARFRGGDRSIIEMSVLEKFGKSAPPGGRILIATQVVEQSLDLDFDELHTDLAPIDLIFQRTGRLHRHVRVRPTGFEEPRLFVHGPSESAAGELSFGNSRFVYDAATLWIAARAVRRKNELSLPNDIRPLVEESYHPESRSVLVALAGSKVSEAEAKLQGDIVRRRTNAKRCCIAQSTGHQGGGGSLNDSEDAVQAFTRDGESTTLLPFWWDGIGGRELFSGDSDPHWDLQVDGPGSWRLADSLIDQTLSVPKPDAADVSSEPIVPSSAWSSWKKRFSRFASEPGLGDELVPLPMRKVGDRFEGSLRSFGKCKTVVYSRTVGLLELREGEEES